MAKNYISIEKFREYGYIFENISKNETLKTELAAYGYDDTEIEKGKALYNTAAESYKTNTHKTSEEIFAYEAFNKKIEELKTSYSTDRKKAKIIYKSEPKVLTVLRINGKMPLRTAKIFEDITVFYQELKLRNELLTPLNRMQIDSNHIDVQLALIEQVKQVEADYQLKKGESQQATKDKDEAFVNADKWVREFFAVAKIALKDKPQLLESLGKLIKR